VNKNTQRFYAEKIYEIVKPDLQTRKEGVHKNWVLILTFLGLFALFIIENIK